MAELLHDWNWNHKGVKNKKIEYHQFDTEIRLLLTVAWAFWQNPRKINMNW